MIGTIRPRKKLHTGQFLFLFFQTKTRMEKFEFTESINAQNPKVKKVLEFWTFPLSASPGKPSSKFSWTKLTCLCPASVGPLSWRTGSKGGCGNRKMSNAISIGRALCWTADSSVSRAEFILCRYRSWCQIRPVCILAKFEQPLAVRAFDSNCDCGRHYLFGIALLWNGDLLRVLCYVLACLTVSDSLRYPH